MTALTYDDRLARLDTLLAEGRITHNEWTGTDRQGREVACLLAALSPEAGEHKCADACPAEVMPAWLAHLTPWMDDNVSARYRPTLLRRYADLAHRWHALTDEDWRRPDYRCRAIAVREARRYTDNTRVIAAIDGVLLLLDRAADGGEVSTQEWAVVRAAAEAAEAEAAAHVAGWAEHQLVADRITAALLDAIEDAIRRRGGGALTMTDDDARALSKGVGS